MVFATDGATIGSLDVKIDGDSKFFENNPNLKITMAKNNARIGKASFTVKQREGSKVILLVFFLFSHDNSSGVCGWKGDKRLYCRFKPVRP